MDYINQFIPENVLYALGWTVLHSLWQAVAVALFLTAWQLGWKKTDARTRYWAGNVALATILAAAVVTFFILLENKTEPLLVSTVMTEEGGLLGEFFIEHQHSAFGAYFSRNMPLIVTGWLVGMAFFLLKMLGGLLYLQRLRHRYVTPLPRQWQEILGALAGEINLERHIRLAESALVRVPMVIGWLKPVILLPVGAVNSLTTEQVEAILAHELAHIARHDFLVNLLQSIIEIIFYFNPAVWWISANVRTERENCCDDLAVRLCGNSLVYAKALVSLQEMHQAAPAFAMPFSSNKNQLFNRIQRILQPSQNKSNVMEKLSATLLLLAAFVMLSVQANTPFGNLLERAVTYVPSETFEIDPEDEGYIYTAYDTIPGTNRETRIHRITEEEEIELRKKNGEIIYLKINGEEIPPERYAEFSDLLEEMDAPVPPTPPTPPTPPAPPSPGSRVTPPAPPAPPMLPTHTRRIITQKGGNGTTFIIESEDGGSPVEIEVKDGKKGKIIINGKELRGLERGDKTIIVEEIAGNPGRIYFHGEPGRPFAMPDMAPLGELYLSPEVLAFDMVEPKIHQRRPATPEFDETWQEKQHLIQEMQDRIRDGNLSKEWLKEFEKQMAQHEIVTARLFELQDLQGKLSEDRARMLELQEELRRKEFKQREKLDRQNEELRNLREDALQRQRDAMEKARQKSRSGKRLIMLAPQDGSM